MTFFGTQVACPTRAKAWVKVVILMSATIFSGCAADLAVADSRGMWLVVGVALMVALYTFRVSLLVVLVLLCPFMFYASIAGQLNLSLADPLVPILAILAVAGSKTVDFAHKMRGYAIGILVTLVWSFLANFLVAGFSASSAALSMAKVMVGLVVGLIVVHLTDEKTLPKIVRAWSLVAVVTALFSILASYGLSSLGRTYGGDRASGSFEDPNLFGAYLVISTSLALTRWNTKSKALRALEVLILITAALATASRGTLVALGVVALVYFLGMPSLGKRVKVVLTGTGTALAVIYFFGIRISDLPGYARVSAASTSDVSNGRFALWGLGFHDWSSNPVFGIGPGQFVDQAQLVAHNTFLSFLVEDGFLGLLAFAWLPLWLIGRLWRQRRVSFNKLCCCAGLAGLLTEMMTLNLQNVRFVWVFVAVAYIAVHQIDGERDEGSSFTGSGRLGSLQRAHQEAKTPARDLATLRGTGI